MLRNFDATVKDFHGNDVFDGDSVDPTTKEPTRVLTVKACIIGALTAGTEEANASGEEKLKRFNLALKVSKGGDIKLSIDEISLIKRAADKVSPTLVYGHIIEALNEEVNHVAIEGE